jgi:hypothetical protein
MARSDSIDPLEAKSAVTSGAAQAAIKREIENILSSYVGWFDPFAELIQNALDSVDERAKTASKSYKPSVRIIVDLKENTLSVSDNGTGLTQEKYRQFLAPSFSFKSGKTRGHKGVGATFLAYGYNYIPNSDKDGRLLTCRQNGRRTPMAFGRQPCLKPFDRSR